ncbi:type II toxin-antitoxin system VapB family antitoxin [Prosthecobacter sp. SYSU 5D2]|uniref:type II toxin-antitoxin system VapB family antitoxin n=1 Tax=Prosthecobacter sp. SYSU 5D2 TaxID=3134134 RepID=UPI0031FEB871
MRITVEIADEIITAAMELTGEKNKSPAIAKAVENYVKRMRAKEFGRRLREGYYDYPMTNEELESLEKI